MESGFKSLRVYEMSYDLAMELFLLSKAFPKIETYSLTDQIRRSSGSVCANIAEGYRKRLYPKHFIMKLTDSDYECSEILVWIDFAFDCGYITENQHDILISKCAEIGKLLGYMISNPNKFI